MSGRRQLFFPVCTLPADSVRAHVARKWNKTYVNRSLRLVAQDAKFATENILKSRERAAFQKDGRPLAGDKKQLHQSQSLLACAPSLAVAKKLFLASSAPGAKRAIHFSKGLSSRMNPVALVGTTIMMRQRDWKMLPKYHDSLAMMRNNTRNCNRPGGCEERRGKTCEERESFSPATPLPYSVCTKRRPVALRRAFSDALPLSDIWVEH